MTSSGSKRIVHACGRLTSVRYNSIFKEGSSFLLPAARIHLQLQHPMAEICRPQKYYHFPFVWKSKTCSIQITYVLLPFPFTPGRCTPTSPNPPYCCISTAVQMKVRYNIVIKRHMQMPYCTSNNCDLREKPPISLPHFGNERTRQSVACSSIPHRGKR